MRRKCAATKNAANSAMPMPRLISERTKKKLESTGSAIAIYKTLARHWHCQMTAKDADDQDEPMAGLQAPQSSQRAGKRTAKPTSWAAMLA